MTLRCHLLGHKRSLSRAYYDDQNACWLSDCKHCSTPLVREWHGAWHAAPRPVRKIAPVNSASLRSRSFTIVIEHPVMRGAIG